MAEAFRGNNKERTPPVPRKKGAAIVQAEKETAEEVIKPNPLEKLSEQDLVNKLKEILGAKAINERINKQELLSLLPPTEHIRPIFYDRNDGLTRIDLDEESPAQKLAELQKIRTDRIELVKILKPFIDEAKRRNLSWAKKFDDYLQIPPEPKVDFADGNLSKFSNKDLFDKTAEILGPDRTIRMFSYNNLSFRNESELLLTNEEIAKLTPLIAEAERRNLSWYQKIKRFFKKQEEPKKQEKQIQNPEAQKRIIALETELKNKYKFKIEYGTLPKDTDPKEFTASKPTDQKLIESELKNLLKILAKYPANIIKILNNTTIYLVTDLKEKGVIIGGFSYGSRGAVFNLVSGVEYSFDHELFHIFDITDGFETDNKNWAHANPQGMAEYTFKNGNEAIVTGKVKSDDIPLEGFATTYSKLGGPDEDQGEAAQYLLNSLTANLMMNRAKKDEVLYKKLEMITGCSFDQAKGEFSRELTKKEYKEKFGFDNFEYYAKWSMEKNGKFTMNTKFWNALAGKIPKEP
ncbi:MAG: hypothetical protein WC806_06300 [Candidatus Gracilibacteria bacterium]